MNSFFVIAALMTGVAVITLIAPLLKGGRSKWTALAIAILVPLSAIGLYARWSGDWRAAAGAPAVAQASGAADVAAMVVTLEQRLTAQPNDLNGWLMLGKSYLILGRTNFAVAAFAQAYRLGGSQNADAALGLGEALSLRNGGRIPSEANRLFEDALALAPDNPKALSLAGLAAAQRGDYAQAHRRWENLKAQHPPPTVAAMLDARLAALDAQTNVSPPKPLADEVHATVYVSLSPSLAARGWGGTPLFVFAQLRDQHGPPLAVKRLTTAALGSAVVLSAGDSMLAGRALRKDMQVLITARIAFSGQPIAASGDLYGQLAYQIGTDRARELIIDKVL